jgi:biotin operon repressor
MDTGEFHYLLKMLKAVADENRLKIIRLVNNQPLSVGDLADHLELTEPTVSHHLSRLREVGLLNMRADGNTRYYQLDKKALKRLKTYVGDLENITIEARPRPDMAWIETLDVSAWERKVFKDYFWGTQLKQIPTKQKKLLVILRWLATKFEPGRTYTEPDVNEILSRYHEDYAQLRRELVELNFLQREGGGGLYWVPPSPTP